MAGETTSAKPSGLVIKLCKRPGKLPLLHCTRGDGSSTVSEISVRPEHDLAHYVVETVLGLRRAFYGLVADGMNIEDFNVPGAARRLRLPHEALQAEFIVGLLQAERRSNAPIANFNVELGRAIESARRPVSLPPAITDELLAEIRQRLDALVLLWESLEPEGSLELEFR